MKDINPYGCWLAQITGVGSRTIEALLVHAACAEEIYRMESSETEMILKEELVRQSDAVKIARAIHSARSQDPSQIAASLIRRGIGFACLEDNDYPQRLRGIPDRPYGLYYIGALPRDDIPAVAIVGARSCSGYGREQARRFAQRLALRGVNVISGMARGVDGIAGRAAAEAAAETIAAPAAKTANEITAKTAAASAAAPATVSAAAPTTKTANESTAKTAAVSDAAPATETIARLTAKTANEITAKTAASPTTETIAETGYSESRSFAVLGCGVDVIYPTQNRDLYHLLARRGGILSEYPPGTQPRTQLFPRRNRLISGLSDVTLVIEARAKSGTLITVDAALEQGREIFAVPGRISDQLSDGCNLLIRQGANIACSPDDILEFLFGISEDYTDLSEQQRKARMQRGQALPPLERALFETLGLGEIMEIDYLWHRAEQILQQRIDISDVMVAMMQLQIKGMAVEVGISHFKGV